MHVYAHVLMYICVCMCVCVWECVCMCVSVCVYVCVCNFQRFFTGIVLGGFALMSPENKTVSKTISLHCWSFMDKSFEFSFLWFVDFPLFILLQPISVLLLSYSLFCFFQARVSLCSLSCPGTPVVDLVGLELRDLPASASPVLGAFLILACSLPWGHFSAGETAQCGSLC